MEHERCRCGIKCMQAYQSHDETSAHVSCCWHTTQTPKGAGNIGDARTFQMTTIRYAINQKKGWPDGSGDCGNTGVCDNVGTNIPINSAHSGGVNALIGDGSVRFLRDSTSLAVLAQLATRNDGIPLSE